MFKSCKFFLLSSLSVLQLFFLLVAVQRPAYAYVDPGSGMLVVQFVGSILSGAVFFLRKRLKQFFFPAKPTQASGEIDS